MKNNKTLALAYCRVSTLSQSEHGLGLDIQKEEIKKYCNKNNLKLLKIYTDQASGSDADRPALLEMLEKIKQDQNIQKIIIAHSSRLARDALLAEIIYRDLKKQGIQLISAREPRYYESDPDNYQQKLIRNILDAISEYEAKLITFRLKSGRRKKAKLGGFCGGSLIYGYNTKNKKLVLNKKEAKIIKKIFYWKRYKKMSCSGISRKLNQLKIKTKRNKSWYPATIQKIISNSHIYKGKIKFLNQIFHGKHPAIIPKSW